MPDTTADFPTADQTLDVALVAYLRATDDADDFSIHPTATHTRHIRTRVSELRTHLRPTPQEPPPA